MGFLYKLDFASGKSYIGVSRVSAEKRFCGHERSVREGADLLVSRVWRKHGAPKLSVLAVVANSDLLRTEQRAVSVFNTMMPHGYNMTPGGEVAPTSVPEIAETSSNALSTVASLRLRGTKFFNHGRLVSAAPKSTLLNFLPWLLVHSSKNSDER